MSDIRKKETKCPKCNRTSDICSLDIYCPFCEVVKEQTNMSDIKQKAREMFTYHADEGTSGYELSDVQLNKLDQIIDLAIAERDRNIVEMITDEWCKSGKDSNKREYLDEIINLINSKK